MITKELTNPTRQQTGSVLNLRLLGTLGILASPMIFVEGLLVGFEQHGTDQLIALLEVIYVIGWMSSIGCSAKPRRAKKRSPWPLASSRM